MRRLIQKWRHARLVEEYRKIILSEAKDAALAVTAFDLVRMRNELREEALCANRAEKSYDEGFYKGQLAVIEAMLKNARS